ncbi:hypothetical protein HHK36_001117 [Tetracentron sinense]|uniref:DNA sliding clamp PCNA n=1 Tax=Tetracentron sinense TaxID=13715 RepID=A0A834ZTE8_TETSI|nr:hypothetical protein HHK36_001117 [Tetracentron sinense]
MLELRLNQASLIKELVSMISGMAEKAIVDCSSDGLSLQARDGFFTRNYLVLHMRSNFFDHFLCDQNISSSINLNDMNRILNRASNGDTVTIKGCNGNNTISFIIEHPSKEKISDEMKLLDTKNERLNIHEGAYEVIVEMTSLYFADLCLRLTDSGYSNTEDLNGGSKKWLRVPTSKNSKGVQLKSLRSNNPLWQSILSVIPLRIKKTDFTFSTVKVKWWMPSVVHICVSLSGFTFLSYTFVLAYLDALSPVLRAVISVANERVKLSNEVDIDNGSLDTNRQKYIINLDVLWGFMTTIYLFLQPEDMATVKTDLKDPVSYTFGLHRMLYIMPASNMSKTVQISMSSGLPVELEYRIEQTGYIRFYFS